MPLFVYPEKVRNFHMYKAFQINVPVNSSCTHLPPPPPGYCGPFARLAVPGVGHLQILRCPGTGHLPTPGLSIPELLTRTRFPIKIPLQRGYYWKKKEGHRALTACSRFYACVSSLLIKIELHRETRELSTWTNVFWIANQISVDIIWRTSFHVYKTIHIIIFIYVGI